MLTSSAFKLGKLARDFKKLTINVTNRAPKKFRKNYVDELQDHATRIAKNLYSANYHIDDLNKFIELCQLVEDDIIYTQFVLEDAFDDQCLTLQDEAELLKKLEEVQRVFEAWYNSTNKQNSYRIVGGNVQRTTK